MPNPVFIGVGRLRGTWNASTNALYQTNGTTSVPTSPSGTIATLSDGNWRNEMDTYVGYSADEGPKVGDYLKVIADGTTEIDGHSDWRIGDWVVYCSGSVWRKVSRADAIASVVVGDMTSSNALSNALLTGAHGRWQQQVLFVSGNAPTASFTGSNNFSYQYATNASTPYSVLRLTGNLLVDGQIQAKQMNTVFHSRSVMYESGSTKFGDSTNDLHEFSGNFSVNSSVTSDWTGSIEFDGDLSGAATHKITFPVVSASTKVVTNALHAPGESDYAVTVRANENTLSGAASSIWAVPVLSASTKVATNALHAPGESDYKVSLSTTAPHLSGAAGSTWSVPDFTASHGITTDRIGPVGDNDLLNLAAASLKVSGTLTLCGAEGTAAAVRFKADDADDHGDTWMVANDPTAHALAFYCDSTSAGNNVLPLWLSGALTQAETSIHASIIHASSLSASNGVYTEQIGLSGDDDLLALASGILTVNGTVSGTSRIVCNTFHGSTDNHASLAMGSGEVKVGSGADPCLLSGSTISASIGIYTPQIGVTGDDDLISLASDHVTFTSKTTHSGTITVYGDEGESAFIFLKADNADDDGDHWAIAGDQNTFAIGNDKPGSMTEMLVLTGAASNANSIVRAFGTVSGSIVSASTAVSSDVYHGHNSNLCKLTFGTAGINIGSAAYEVGLSGSIISASIGFYAPQIGVSGDDDLLALSSGELVVNGKMGIGITDPDSYVDEKDNLVVGSTTGNTGMTLVSSPTAITTIQFRGNTTVNDKEGWIDYSQNTEKMRFGTAGLNTRMTIDDAGNVGIGVGDPDSKLEVAGKIHISDEQGSAPSAPSDGDGGFLYAKADGKIYWRSNELSETDLTTGGGGGGSIDGSGGTNRISFWSDADTLSSDANFTWTDGSDLLTMSGTLLLTSNTTTDHRVSGSLLLKTDSTSDPGSNDTGFCVRGDGAGSEGRGILTVDDNNNGLLVLSASGGKTMFRAGTSTETAPHADYNIDRARKFILSGSTFIGSSGQTQTNVDTHDVWGHFYCTSGSIRIMSGATGRQDDFYGINLPNHSDKLGSIRANAFPTYSSIRWKYNVENINDPIARINQLRGVFFDWKETGKGDMGFIAEEVGEVLPRIVRYEDDGVSAESLDYGKIIPLCVEAIKALSTKNEFLEKQIQELKKKI